MSRGTAVGMETGRKGLWRMPGDTQPGRHYRAAHRRPSAQAPSHRPNSNKPRHASDASQPPSHAAPPQLTLQQVLRHRRHAAAVAQLAGRRAVLLAQRAQQAQRRQAGGPPAAAQLGQQRARQQVQLLGCLLAPALHAVNGALQQLIYLRQGLRAQRGGTGPRMLRCRPRGGGGTGAAALRALAPAAHSHYDRAVAWPAQACTRPRAICQTPGMRTGDTSSWLPQNRCPASWLAALCPTSGAGPPCSRCTRPSRYASLLRAGRDTAGERSGRQ